MGHIWWRSDSPLFHLRQVYNSGMWRLTVHSYFLTYWYKKENDWPHPPNANRKTRPRCNVLDARRRQKKDGEAEEDMAKYISRRCESDVCELAWSPPDRQWPVHLGTSRRPMLRDEQAQPSLGKWGDLLVHSRCAHICRRSRSQGRHRQDWRRRCRRAPDVSSVCVCTLHAQCPIDAPSSQTTHWVDRNIPLHDTLQYGTVQ